MGKRRLNDALFLRWWRTNYRQSWCSGTVKSCTLSVLCSGFGLTPKPHPIDLLSTNAGKCMQIVTEAEDFDDSLYIILEGLLEYAVQVCSGRMGARRLGG